MANSINSISTGTGGLQSTADGTSGNLLIQKDAGTIATFSSSGVVVSGVVAATTLTGDGSAITGIVSGGAATLISTLNTTSGTELTTGTLDLTTYKTIYVKITNIGQGTDTGSLLQWKNNGGAYQTIFTDPSDTSESGMGYIICKPAETIPYYYQWASTYGARGRDWNVAVGGGPNYKFTTAMMITSATTSISFKWSGGQTFNLGQILIYGQT